MTFGSALSLTGKPANGKRARSESVWASGFPSEVMTILMHFHQSHYRTFKAYDTEHVQVHLTREFPQRVALSALCGAHPAHDASPAWLPAEPIGGLYGDELH